MWLADRMMVARSLEVRRRGRFDAPIVQANWLLDKVAIAVGDGAVRFWAGDDETAVAAHKGAILCAHVAPDRAGLLTGGDDGALVRTKPDGQVETLQRYEGAWVQHLAASAVSGAVSLGVGKKLIALKAGGTECAYETDLPSSVGGVAIAKKGRLLAASHYGGVRLGDAFSKTPAKTLEWKGSHLTVAMPKDGSYLLTAMQEHQIHGWRLSDMESLGMNGYSTKVRSFSWSASGKALATSGAYAAIIWPFTGRAGPMGKAPHQIAIPDDDGLVTFVAFHPREDMLAIGCESGAVYCARLAGGPLRRVEAQTGAAVTTLAWSRDGRMLAYGDFGGNAGLADCRDAS